MPNNLVYQSIQRREFTSRKVSPHKAPGTLSEWASISRKGLDATAKTASAIRAASSVGSATATNTKPPPPSPPPPPRFKVLCTISRVSPDERARRMITCQAAGKISHRPYSDGCGLESYVWARSSTQRRPYGKLCPCPKISYTVEWVISKAYQYAKRF
jgi:hypothetical protein